MNSFYSQQAGCTVRWHDLPGSGDPVVFIHGLGCASSYEYPRVVRDPLFGARRAILIDCPAAATAINLSTTAIKPLTRRTLWRS
jgi:pimeloyl-ACP methyl ester carboxylesterase